MWAFLLWLHAVFITITMVQNLLTLVKISPRDSQIVGNVLWTKVKMCPAPTLFQ